MKTKVFAGGAMIAEQNAVLARVEWTSADPVTGSSAKILRSGLFVDEERKELEPLGQEILPIEPPNEQPAPSPENVRFSAQESEWQCKASEARFGREDFFSKPIHCQKAALAANDVGLYSLHPYKEEKDISTASDITRSYSFRSMMPDRMMTYSLRSSAKKTDGDHDDDDDDEIIPPHEYVEVKDEIFEEIDASKSGQDDQVRPKLGKGVPENLKNLVLSLGNYKKCGEVFEQLIQTSSKKHKEWQKKSQESGKSIIETVYDSVKSIKIDSKIRSEGGNAGGHITFKEDYNNDGRGAKGAWAKFAIMTMQEMIHQVFNDADLRTASQKLIDSGNLDPTIKASVDSMVNSNDGKLYEHHVLGAACAINDLELNDMFNRYEFDGNLFSEPYW